MVEQRPFDWFAVTKPVISFLATIAGRVETTQVEIAGIGSGKKRSQGKEWNFSAAFGVKNINIIFTGMLQKVFTTSRFGKTENNIRPDRVKLRTTEE